MFPGYGSRRTFRGRGRGSQLNAPNVSNTTLRDRDLERRIVGYVNNRIHSVTHGQRFEPPLTPPQFSTQPWNSAVVRVRGTFSSTNATYSVEKIWKALAGQIGLYYDSSAFQSGHFVPCDLRIQKIMAWTLSTSISGIVRIFPYNFQDAVELAVLDSVGQKNMYATVGYVWPASLQNHVLSSTTSKSTTVFVIDGSDNVSVEIHITVLWKSVHNAELKQIYAQVSTYDPEAVQRICPDHMTLEDSSKLLKELKLCSDKLNSIKPIDCAADCASATTSSSSICEVDTTVEGPCMLTRQESYLNDYLWHVYTARPDCVCSFCNSYHAFKKRLADKKKEEC